MRDLFDNDPWPSERRSGCISMLVAAITVLLVAGILLLTIP